MKTVIALVLVAFTLFGCGNGESNNNHGYGYEYDQSGETGTRVNYIDGQVSPSLSEIEKWYIEAMTCSGITASGPLIVFVESLGPYTRGKTFLDTGTVVIATLINSNESGMVWTHKHEFIHYLLHQSGFDVKDNVNHNSSLFLECTVPKYS